MAPKAQNKAGVRAKGPAKHKSKPKHKCPKDRQDCTQEELKQRDQVNADSTICRPAVAADAAVAAAFVAAAAAAAVAAC